MESTSVEIFQPQNIPYREKWPQKITGKIPFFTRKTRFSRADRKGSFAQNRVINFSHLARQQHRICANHRIWPLYEPCVTIIAVEAAFAGLDFPPIRRLWVASNCERAATTPWMGALLRRLAALPINSGTPVHPLPPSLFAFNIPVRCPW
jgi:hypothetical protein